MIFSSLFFVMDIGSFHCLLKKFKFPLQGEFPLGWETFICPILEDTSEEIPILINSCAALLIDGELARFPLHSKLTCGVKMHEFLSLRKF